MRGKIILGLTENVTLIGPQQHHNVLARIDTGATGSSLDINLAAQLDLSPGHKSKLIKSASGVRHRPVVTAKIRMDGLTITEEFSLADRSHMTYPVLIGQNILRKGNFLIDPQKVERQPLPQERQP